MKTMNLPGKVLISPSDGACMQHSQQVRQKLFGAGKSEAVCGSTSPDHECAGVSLVRVSAYQLTVMAGVKALTAFQNAKRGLK